MTDTNTGNPLIPAPAIAAELGVNIRTLDRWLRDPDLAFPKPVRIKTRNYFPRAEIDNWKNTRLRASLGKVG